MEGSTLGSKEENHSQTGLPLLLSNMEGEIILWYRGVWGGMGWKSLQRFRGPWMHSNTVTS